MCGRARCSLAPEQVVRAARIPEERWKNRESYNPSYNVSPGFSTPVLKYGKDGELDIHTMKWGLIPSYTKPGEKLDPFCMFNARSETVPEKGVFKRLLSKQRCIVLLNGFYEWHKGKTAKDKQPYYIHLGEGQEGDDVLKLAGLYDCWHGAEGEPLYSYTILTTDSSPRLRWLHDRMPVILHDEAAQKAWLDTGAIPEAEQYAKITAPYNGEDLVWHPVTKSMGNAKFQGPECCEEVKKDASVAAFFKPKPAGEEKAKPSGEVATGSKEDTKAGGPSVPGEGGPSKSADFPSPGISAREGAGAEVPADLKGKGKEGEGGKGASPQSVVGVKRAGGKAVTSSPAKKAKKQEATLAPKAARIDSFFKKKAKDD